MTDTASSAIARRRLADLDLEIDARPTMPSLGPLTPLQKRKGTHLAAIHRHYLSDLRKVAAVLDRVRLGEAAPEELKEIILASEMSENFAAVGTICGHQCQVLQMHHDIEEGHMFPGLAAQDNAPLRRVVEKLKAEHLIIHELLNRLRTASDHLSAAPTQSQFDTVYNVFDALFRAVVSHFGYEETELAEAIGLYLEDV